MDPETLGALVQFGAAGLMGWMWLSERRSAVARERQLDEAHAAIMSERQKLDVLVSALEGNTRAITALEAGQRRLLETIERREGKSRDGSRRAG